MNIQWVNHASFILRTEHFTIITDPWIEGRVFNNSWELLAETVFSYDDFKNVTHIWFSHEHPDHFFPPNLKKIKPEIRSQITIIFQKTADQKVAAFCRKLGFKSVLEISPFEKFQLSPNCHIQIGTVKNDIDSWILFDFEGSKILNLNDCVFENDSDLEEIKKSTGDIDVLMTQFSYANWVGNKNDVSARKEQAALKIDEVITRIKILSPSYTIPFASFVRFCHIDNVFMNDAANDIRKVCSIIEKTNSVPVIMYPGQKWSVDKAIDNESALAAYEKDASEKNTTNLYVPDKISLEKLQSSAQVFKSNCLKSNSFIRLILFKPFTFHLTDYSESFSFSFKHGLQKVQLNKEFCDIMLRSQSILYCFQNLWGWDTLLVGGYFEKPSKGNFDNFMRYQWVARINNIGKRIEPIHLVLRKKLLQRLR